MATTDSARPDPPSERRAPAREMSSVARSADGRRIAYATYGPPDGDPVVFFHGTPGSRRLGALLEPAARANDVRVIAPDRPGYGRSPPQSGRTVGDAAASVRPVLNDLGVERAALVAFSGGAPYTLATAASLGDRVTGVDLVAGATPPSFGDDTPAVQRLLSGLAAATPSVLGALLRGQAWVASRADPSFVVAQYAEDADAVPEDAATVVKEDFLAAFERHRNGAVTEFRDAGSDWGIDLDAVDAPVRLWHGTDDANVPVAGAERLAEALPTAELRVLDGADHLGTLLRAAPEALSRSR
ncbi:alpha/beta hydrolase [Halorubrum sp. SD690R]|uniref:alpha/beta fold hydrolase n=1 Tax=Halorubrum sp. SD690R TaxID=2518117 RepID=UPI0010F77876|nr:alpha/beta hydrolase [Halorubrum sp. SD690R]TKX43125.1 alpha/beta hydrolase [Halorubrum sp. SD690R]